MNTPETWEVLAWHGLEQLDQLGRPKPSPPPASPRQWFAKDRALGRALVRLFWDPPESPPAAVISSELEPSKAPSPRPSTWEDVIGNETAVEILREQLTAARLDHKPVPHTLLYGVPGSGKSTLAKILAASTRGGFIETTASTLESMSDLMRLVYELNTLYLKHGNVPATLFVDEIHMLGQAKGRQSVDQESVFTLLEDFVLHHNLMGKKAFTDSNGIDVIPQTSTARAMPFTVIGATTEPGMLSEPLRRRFLVHVELEPYTEPEIAEIITRAGPRMGWSIDPEAAQYLAQYARRNPGKSYQLLTQARNRAVATEQATITLQVASEVISRLKLYPLGLTNSDVRILQILADHQPRGCGHAELCRASAISLSQFSGIVEPYLRFLQFIEIASRRIITPKGLQYLASITPK
jgi:Holliday junction DNA helicase RuvB